MVYELKSIEASLFIECTGIIHQMQGKSVLSPLQAASFYMLLMFAMIATQSLGTVYINDRLLSQARLTVWGVKTMRMRSPALRFVHGSSIANSFKFVEQRRDLGGLTRGRGGLPRSV